MYKLAFICLFAVGYAQNIPEPASELLTPFAPREFQPNVPVTPEPPQPQIYQRPTHPLHYKEYKPPTVAPPAQAVKRLAPTPRAYRPLPVTSRPIPGQPIAAFRAAAAPAAAPQTRRVPTPRLSGGGPEQHAQILRQEQDLSPDGNSYAYSFETDNGIAAQEQGSVRQLGQEAAAVEASGSFQYTAPDGTPIALSYIANENGFQPQGAHLPTSPPIPKAILRALEYIRSHPPAEDVAGRRRNY